MKTLSTHPDLVRGWLLALAGMPVSVPKPAPVAARAVPLPVARPPGR